jgi:hypothetical protein
MQYCLNKYVIECSIESGDNLKEIAETKEKIYKRISDVITALRLLKEGYVESNVILFGSYKRIKETAFIKGSKDYSYRITL